MFDNEKKKDNLCNPVPSLLRGRWILDRNSSGRSSEIVVENKFVTNDLQRHKRVEFIEIPKELMIKLPKFLLTDINKLDWNKF